MRLGSDLFRPERRDGSLLPALKRRKVPIAVSLGFSLLLILWLVSQFYFLRGLDEVEERASAISLRFAQAEELLSTLRTQRLSVSIYLRDVALDPTEPGITLRRLLIDQARDRMDQALAGYEALGISAAERAGVEALRESVRAYWDTVAPILSRSATGRSADARDLLLEGGAAQREAIIRISDQIQELNRTSFIRQQAEVARAYRSLDRLIRTINAVTLCCGLLIAVAITAYAGRLERHIRNQVGRNALHAQNLRRLSAKLVHVQEEERRTISRELHDEVGQALTAIRIEIGIARRKMEQTGQLANLLDVAEGLTDNAIETVRHLSQLLHPSLLDHLGLPAALDWYLQGFSRRTGIRTELTTAEVDARYSPAVETCIFRIAQEALTNVARHAGATTCRVRLARVGGGLQMTVQDDGKGFDLKQHQGQEHAGLGLLGVRERVTGFGGSLALETAPGEGTSLTVELPNVIECAEGTHGREPGEATAQRGGAS
jgi:signal transduction histidine kinase